MGIATAIIALGIVVTTALGPEKRGRKFESVGPPIVVAPKDLEEGVMAEKERANGASAIEHNEKATVDLEKKV